MAPVALNAQQPPHEPWFLTGVTAFFVRQSTAAGGASISSASSGAFRELRYELSIGR
jgi:hypothetical protein